MALLTNYAILNGDVIEVSFRSSLFSQRILAILHYQALVNTPIADGINALTELAEVLATTGLFAAYKTAVSSDMVDNHLRVQKVYPVRYAAIDFDEYDGNGAATAAIETPNVAAAITKKGILAERSGVGTLHLAGIPSSYIVDGAITQLGKDALEPLVTQLQQTVTVSNDNQFVPIIFHRADPANNSQIVDAAIQDTVRVMRRRTVSVGI